MSQRYCIKNFYNSSFLQGHWWDFIITASERKARKKAMFSQIDVKYKVSSQTGTFDLWIWG